MPRVLSSLFLTLFLSQAAPVAHGAVASSSPAFPADRGQTVRYVYGDVGPAERALGFVCHAGQTCEADLGDGARRVFDYAFGPGNPYGELAQTATLSADGTVRARFGTRYRLDGRIVEETTRYDDGKVRETTDRYDALGRLIERRVSGGDDSDETFAYDANDNMRLRAGENAVTRYGYTGLDEQRDLDGQILPRRYDARGNRLYDEDGQIYRHDDETRVIGETNPTWGSRDYRYWPGGLRARKGWPNGDGLLYYAEGDQTSNAEDEQTGELSHYLLAGGRLARWVSDADGRVEQRRYLLADNTGSVRAETEGRPDMTVPAASKRDYSAYGRPNDAPPPENRPNLKRNPFGFDGEYQDLETGDTYLRARYADGRGRFTAQDNLQTLNRYVTFDDDPVNKTDPSGHFPKEMAWSPNWAGPATSVVLSAVYAMLWNAGEISSKELAWHVGMSALAAIKALVPGLAPALENYVAQYFSGQADDAAWWQVAWQVGMAVGIDLALRMLAGRCIKKHHDTLKYWDDFIDEETIKNDDFKSVGKGEEGTVYRGPAELDDQVYKVFDKMSDTLKKKLMQNSSEETIAQRNARLLNLFNADTGFEATAVGPNKEILKMPYLTKEQLFLPEPLEKLEASAGQEIWDKIVEIEGKGYLVTDANGGNFGRYNDHVVIIDVGQTFQYPADKKRRIDSVYSEQSLDYFWRQKQGRQKLQICYRRKENKFFYGKYIE